MKRDTSLPVKAPRRTCPGFLPRGTFKTRYTGRPLRRRERVAWRHWTRNGTWKRWDDLPRPWSWKNKSAPVGGAFSSVYSVESVSDSAFRYLLRGRYLHLERARGPALMLLL